MEEMTLQDLSENLADLLPSHQRKYTNTPSYKALVMAVWQFLWKHSDEHHSELIHAKMIFDDLCSMEANQ